MRELHEAEELTGKYEAEELPDILYRYCSLDGARFDWFTQMFRDNKIWFAKPADFNDPFECQFRMSFDASTYQKETRYVEYQVKKGCKPREAWKRAKKFFRPKGLNEIREWERERLEAFKKMLLCETGMLCLSEVRDDILMWSHYADSHRGTCLEFGLGGYKSMEYVDFFARAHKVRYQKGVPRFEFYRPQDAAEQVAATVLTKANHWEYEKEWRIVDLDPGPGLHNIPEGIISGVILGLQMPDDQRERVRHVIAECKSDVPIYEARRHEGAYALDICET